MEHDRNGEPQLSQQEVEESRQGQGHFIEEGIAQGRALAVQEREELLERRRQEYREGLRDEAREGLCNAPAPDVLLGGEAIYCGRAAGHDLGPYERHKAVLSDNPAMTIVWNEPD